MLEISTITIDSTLTFSRLNAMLNEQGSFEVANNLRVGNVQLRGDDQWLYADAVVDGTYKGNVTVRCKAHYNNDMKRVELEDLNIELDKDNFFARLARKFLNQFFVGKIDAKLEEAINERFMLIMDEMLAQMRGVPLPKGGVLSFDTQSFRLHELRTDPNGLHFSAHLTGVASLVY